MDRIFHGPITRFSNICGRFARCNVMPHFFFYSVAIVVIVVFERHVHVINSVLFFSLPISRSISNTHFSRYKIQFIVRSIGKEIDCSIHNVSHRCCCCYSYFPIMLCHARVICLTHVRIVLCEQHFFLLLEITSPEIFLPSQVRGLKRKRN